MNEQTPQPSTTPSLPLSKPPTSSRKMFWIVSATIILVMVLILIGIVITTMMQASGQAETLPLSSVSPTPTKRPLATISPSTSPTTNPVSTLTPGTSVIDIETDLNNTSFQSSDTDFQQLNQEIQQLN